MSSEFDEDKLISACTRLAWSREDPPTDPKNVWWVPVTPAGTALMYGAANRMGKVNMARTREKAKRNLMEDAQHMPYRTWKDFVNRGYTIERWTMPRGWRP